MNSTFPSQRFERGSYGSLQTLFIPSPIKKIGIERVMAPILDTFILENTPISLILYGSNASVLGSEKFPGPNWNRDRVFFHMLSQILDTLQSKISDRLPCLMPSLQIQSLVLINQNNEIYDLLHPVESNQTPTECDAKPLKTKTEIQSCLSLMRYNLNFYEYFHRVTENYHVLCYDLTMTLESKDPANSNHINTMTINYVMNYLPFLKTSQNQLRAQGTLKESLFKQLLRNACLDRKVYLIGLLSHTHEATDLLSSYELDTSLVVYRAIDAILNYIKSVKKEEDKSHRERLTDQIQLLELQVSWLSNRLSIVEKLCSNQEKAQQRKRKRIDEDCLALSDEEPCRKDTRNGTKETQMNPAGVIRHDNFIVPPALHVEIDPSISSITSNTRISSPSSVASPRILDKDEKLPLTAAPHQPSEQPYSLPPPNNHQEKPKFLITPDHPILCEYRCAMYKELPCSLCQKVVTDYCRTCSQYFKVRISMCDDCFPNHYSKIIRDVNHLKGFIKHVNDLRKEEMMKPFQFFVPSKSSSLPSLSTFTSVTAITSNSSSNGVVEEIDGGIYDEESGAWWFHSISDDIVSGSETMESFTHKRASSRVNKRLRK